MKYWLLYPHSLTQKGARYLEAVRELIVNAIAHRDYSIRSPIYIRIYDNKIVIENPGGLPPGITVDELKKPHRSVLRNPKIANVLYNLGYIEKWGDLKLFSSSIKL